MQLSNSRNARKTISTAEWEASLAGVPVSKEYVSALILRIAARTRRTHRAAPGGFARCAVARMLTAGSLRAQ